MCAGMLFAPRGPEGRTAPFRRFLAFRPTEFAPSDPSGRAARARRWVTVETHPGPVGGQVRIATDGVVLQADLVVPEDAMGIVAFAHGSGSGRFSPRNRFVASALNKAGLGTLLADLLTASEERVDARTAALRFDIDLLTRRLIGIVDWLSEDEATQRLPIGLFGASTGAAAAVRAGAACPGLVRAIVSRGGRVDLAEDELPRCTAPTLLIVGGDDQEVLALNRQALDQSSATAKQLVVVAGATHLFEERGALEQVARSAATWFLEHLGATAPTAAMRSNQS
jgi:putative phosphoribosyl transferase